MVPVSRVRAGAAFWCLLCTIWLASATGFTLASPGGAWMNAIYGSPLWSEDDPGGFYLPSAHQLVEDRGRPLFPGHPGAPLHLLLHGVQRAHFAILGSNELDFTEFTARHLGDAWIAAKTTMTLVFLVSFFLLYRLARRLVGERAAILATLGFATSLPVLYFLSRVAVEGLMVAIFIATLLSLGSALDRVDAGKKRAALGYALAAGLLAISGAAAKLNFLGPLPFFGLLYIVVETGLRGPGDKRGVLRWQMAAAFGTGVLVGALLYLQVIHIQDFRTVWLWIASSIQVSPEWSLERFLPAPTTYGIFQLCETVFIAMGIVGGVLYLRKPSASRREASWIALYLIYATALWAFRIAWLDFRAFHYFFLPLVGLSIFFGFLGDRILERIQRKIALAGGWVGILVLIVVVHGVALVSVAESRFNDIAQYRSAAIFEVARTLGPNDRVELLSESVPEWYRKGWREEAMTSFSGLRSLEDCPTTLGCVRIRPPKCPIERNIDVIDCSVPTPRLMAEFNSLFRLSRDPRARDHANLILPALGRGILVRGEPRPSPVLSEQPAND